MPAEPIVLDASAVVDLLLGTDDGAEVATRVRGAPALLAPAHVDAEVFSALARLARSGAVPDDVVTEALDDLASMPMQRTSVSPLLADAWTMRHNATARDALYIVVAQRAGATLVTSDRPLARAVVQQGWCPVWTPP